MPKKYEKTIADRIKDKKMGYKESSKKDTAADRAAVKRANAKKK